MAGVKVPSVPKVKMPAEHIAHQFGNVHPSKVSDPLHSYYEVDREENFIGQHPFGIAQELYKG